jgi:diguanylate cyclase (GGDEF)-like protein
LDLRGEDIKCAATFSGSESEEIDQIAGAILRRQQLEPLASEGGDADKSSVISGRIPVRRFQLTISRKFFGVLMVLWPLMLALALVGVIGLGSVKAAFDQQYARDVHAGQASIILGTDLANADETALRLLLARGRERQGLNAALDRTVLPAVNTALSEVRSLDPPDVREERPAVQQLASGWSRFLSLRETGALGPAAGRVGATRANHVAKQLAGIFGPLRGVIQRQAALEQTKAQQAEARADRIYGASLLTIWIIAAAAFVLGVGAVLLLTRNVVLRVRRYSQFAARVAKGDLSQRLATRGSDELATLGRALDELVEHRALDATHRSAQDEFVETLQVTDSEDIAHDLLRRQIERSISGSSAVVLNRNNSENRLEAKTPVSESSWLNESLANAGPRSCLAVRFARQHCESPEREPLSHCEICGGKDRRTTCQPLLVGGEVIGSVLIEHADRLREQDKTAVQESVSQAAPVLANLRNLASAELRALTDSLTGLANKRAVKDTTKRMAAYASRTVSPLSAIALDLDHFKQINDSYGHESGDAVLAAAGAALTNAVRASDFVGRNGGEEFLVLLPDTATESAVIVAERIRQAMTAISVPGVDREITVSIGIATLPEHAGDDDQLIRSADRALYAAKANGRNRIDIAPSPLHETTINS